MSLTNPNKLVTEERLSDFYQQILPYMGGMPEILANKFSKDDLYSTDEKMIGQWIDGKPLYQKTITYTGGISTSWRTIASLDSYIAAVVSSEFVSYDPALNSWILLNSDQDKFEVFISFDLTNHVIKIKTDTAWSRSDYVVYMTYRYTKTTDSAIDIGNETDYSITEKIIGTWIDGKPLYQKTFTSITPTTAGVDLVSGVDTFVNALQIIRLYSSDSAYISTGSGSSNTNFISFKLENNILKLATVTSDYTAGACTVTVQYTKTSESNSE